MAAKIARLVRWQPFQLSRCLGSVFFCVGDSQLMDRSALVKLFGFPATLVHGDPLVLDRWFWLKARLPKTRNDEHLLDVGCGTGAFSIGAALRGYRALGLSWDERNQSLAKERATYCNTSS